MAKAVAGSEYLKENYSSGQGCQMVCFQTKNPNLGKFCRVLVWKILVYFMTIWSTLWPLEMFYGHLVYFVVIWYIFPCFGILDQEKSGNPASGQLTRKLNFIMAWPKSGNAYIQISWLHTYIFLGCAAGAKSSSFRQC
jgi:hypothetical protein